MFRWSTANMSRGEPVPALAAYKHATTTWLAHRLPAVLRSAYNSQAKHNSQTKAHCYFRSAPENPSKILEQIDSVVKENVQNACESNARK